MSSPAPAVRCGSLLLLALLVLAPRAPAQASAASKSLKAAAKAELKALKAELATAVADLDFVAGAFEDDVVAGEPLAPAVQTFAASWSAVQANARDAVLQHRSALISTASDLLEAFQADVGGVIGGPYPTGFNPGDGGGIDVWDQGWRKELEKARAKMDARLAKLRKPLEKAGFAFDVRTRGTNVQVGYSLEADAGSGSSIVSSTSGFSIDLLLSVDPLEGDDDAIFALAGMAPFGEDVFVELLSTEQGSFDATVPAQAGDRWEVLFEERPEGNYEVRALQGANTLPLRDAIGAG